MQTDLKIVDRIRKLLALAQSSNPHEAANAAARAAELMAEHQIAEASIEVDGELGGDLANAAGEAIDEQVVEQFARAVSWKAMLIGGLARAFGCRAIQRRKDGTVSLVIIGRPSDIDAFRYMWSYLTAEIDRLADEGWRTARSDSSARSWKNSFRVSAAAEVSRRLLETRQQAMTDARSNPQAGAAMLKIDRHEDALTQYLADMGTRAGRPVRIRQNGGEDAGRAAGEQLNLGNNPGLGRPARQLQD